MVVFLPNAGKVEDAAQTDRVIDPDFRQEGHALIMSERVGISVRETTPDNLYGVTLVTRVHRRRRIAVIPTVKVWPGKSYWSSARRKSHRGIFLETHVTEQILVAVRTAEVLNRHSKSPVMVKSHAKAGATKMVSNNVAKIPNQSFFILILPIHKKIAKRHTKNLRCASLWRALTA